MKAYANPVGNIKKDIYIIRNDINDKVYIGQSIDSEQRFKSHCKKNHDNSIIDKAIQKYGKNHFWYEILESQIDNYNEREKYWITYYNSITPNGYNILQGGESPPIMRGEDHPTSKLSDLDVLKIKEDLRNSSISLEEISRKYAISKRQVLRINHGNSRGGSGETYPIRNNPNSPCKLTADDVSTIIQYLKYTYRTNGEIAKEFGVEGHVINRINKGESYRVLGEEYPIRKWKSCGETFFTYEQVTEIIYLLKTTDLSFRKIGKMYGASHHQISDICNGTSKKYYRETESYPIRKSS